MFLKGRLGRPVRGRVWIGTVRSRKNPCREGWLSERTREGRPALPCQGAGGHEECRSDLAALQGSPELREARHLPAHQHPAPRTSAPCASTCAQGLGPALCVHLPLPPGGALLWPLLDPSTPTPAASSCCRSGPLPEASGPFPNYPDPRPQWERLGTQSHLQGKLGLNIFKPNCRDDWHHNAKKTFVSAFRQPEYLEEPASAGK